MAAITTAPYKKLIKVGFSPREAALLLDPAPNLNSVRYRNISPRKLRLFRSGATLTMALLLKNGFTRAQAKVILGL
jgi:hypothetical protein